MGMIRKLLDGLYFLGGVLGGISMIAILILICVQMVSRWLGTSFPGAANYAGYCMAASIFFALAYALNHGAHIRVTLILSGLGRSRKLAEIWCYGFSAILITFFFYAAFERNHQSQKFNFLSQGQDEMPLWIPELSMTIGAGILAIALWDHVIRLLFTSYAGIEDLPPEERTE
nr:TRAP transporter small permease [uncultured Tateyamaria sp.]